MLRTYFGSKEPLHTQSLPAEPGSAWVPALASSSFLAFRAILASCFCSFDICGAERSEGDDWWTTGPRKKETPSGKLDELDGAKCSKAEWLDKKCGVTMIYDLSWLLLKIPDQQTKS